MGVINPKSPKGPKRQPKSPKGLNGQAKSPKGPKGQSKSPKVNYAWARGISEPQIQYNNTMQEV